MYSKTKRGDAIEQINTQTKRCFLIQCFFQIGGSTVNKKMMTATLGCALAFGLTMTAFAASTSFSATLPAHQGDTEVSTVRKATSTKSFSITINSIGSGTDTVCAWTEGDSTGTNYSSPYNQVGIETKSFSYTTQPEIGENVVLNLDNPVDIATSVKVTGSWTPN